MRYNYHTHTYRCKHSTGLESDYVLNAIDHGYAALGFTDHCPWPYEDDFVSSIRMSVKELDGYIGEIRRLEALHADKIRVFCGLECEYFPAYMQWLRDIKAEKGLDYLILGNHHDGTDNGGAYFGGSASPEQIRQYLKQTIAGMESGLFAYVAHPDLFLRMHRQFDADCEQGSRELCRAAVALGIPLEYNLLGMRYNAKVDKRHGFGYPCEPFWHVAAEEGVTAIIGVDAHHPEHLNDPELYDLAAIHLEALGLRRIEQL